MSDLKACFRALGFDRVPTEQELKERYIALNAKRRSETESDNLARKLLQENYELALEELGHSEENGG